jgi:hypothetical protein
LPEKLEETKSDDDGAVSPVTLPSSAKREVTALLALPMDSLHHFASFLTPSEFTVVAQSSQTANRVFREIIRRVRRHGFKCATEVVTAWKLGHHSDAKELVALYIQSGVPIYPRSLGHSYHTLLWRMGVETREVLHQPRAETKIDLFYKDRADFRTAEEYTPELSFVEEKCLFWATTNSSQAARPGRPRSPTRPRHALVRQNSNDTAGSRPTSPVLSDTDSVLVDRLPLRVHQHLLDQHKRRKICVNDNDGKMITPGISLSADFYHPSYDSEATASSMSHGTLIDLQSIPENIEASHSAQEDGEEDAPAPELIGVVEGIEAVDADALLLGDGSSLTDRRRPPAPAKIAFAMQSCDVEAYTASVETSLMVDEGDGSHELRKHLRSRFTTYQRRLETFLTHLNNSGFEECIMDFWDEFFPHTSYIQYYDLHTAVPRVSCLHKFLTRPCPKAIGIVQCEIERIKITSKKGVSMKGRLFPTYEYRLFIRHRPHNQAPESALTGEEDEGFDRRDTVLMVAKNRGRKHTEMAGVGPTKKGSNNYYLYMPQQMDVDSHYNKMNILPEPSKMNPNGASLEPVIVSEDSSSVLMGRLQSNFIGTEFQIFSPHKKKQQRRKVEPQMAKTVYSPSDDEVDYDSSHSSETNSSLRSRLARFRLGLSTADSSGEFSNRARARSVPRSVSATEGMRRPSRRAVANAEGVVSPSTMSEEEVGVITYTANLLGSRPRIMDVCIPKVTVDGATGADWRLYLENMEDQTEEGRMLSSFRQLLQRLENLDPQPPRQDGGDGGAGGAQEPHHGDQEEVDPEAGPPQGEDFGLLPLQNRPPWWNVELGSFVLNFGGRVSVASVKNFQLCDRTDQDNIMLQFGRIHGRHSFTMDFQYPLTAVQAFSIAISSLQSKISFG